MTAREYREEWCRGRFPAEPYTEHNFWTDAHAEAYSQAENERLARCLDLVSKGEAMTPPLAEFVVSVPDTLRR